MYSTTVSVDGGEEDQQGDELMAQRDVQRAPVAADQPVEARLDDAVQPAVLAPWSWCRKREHIIGVSVSETTAETTTAMRHRHGELAEQPADDAAHQQQRDEHRDQRDADRDDGEADLAGALAARPPSASCRPRCGGRCSPASRWRRRPRSRPRWSAPSATGCRGCSPAGYITAKVPISATGTVTLGMMRRPHVAQEQEDHHHHQADRQQQRELHVVHRGADGLRAVDHDRRRAPRAGSPPRSRGSAALIALHRVDHVGAGLLEDRPAARRGLPFCKPATQRVLRRRRPPGRCRARAPARRCGRRAMTLLYSAARGELVVGVDGVGALRRRRSCPSARSTVALASTLRTSSSVRPIAASLAGSTCTRTARFCSPPMNTCATPAICDICCDRMLSA